MTGGKGRDFQLKFGNTNIYRGLGKPAQCCTWLEDVEVKETLHLKCRTLEQPPGISRSDQDSLLQGTAVDYSTERFKLLCA